MVHTFKRVILRQHPSFLALLKSHTTWGVEQYLGTRRLSTARRTMNLEVESKFTPRPGFRETAAQRHQKEKPGAKMANRFIWSTETRSKIQDTYLDHAGELMKNGIYVRRRREISSTARSDSFMGVEPGDDWEAKVSVGGDFINSQFNEVQGVDAVQNAAGKFLPHIQLSELIVVADFHTHRSKWDITLSTGYLTLEADNIFLNGEMSVVVDEVISSERAEEKSNGGFQHMVGEIEVLVPSFLLPDHDRESLAKTQVIAQMNKYISEFKLEHADMISSTKPTGKLTAFFDWHKK
ncbi:hypothetical protein MRB53_040486 [Persea americana]|nr:hypothetical protein MRB53_040486 [Persea americana]